MSNTIRVRAVGDGRLPVPGTGGRFVGRSKSGDIIAAGVDVPDDSYHRRALASGALELVAVEEPAVPATPAPMQADAEEPATQDAPASSQEV